ncbi:hypothetical protein FRC09_010841 [Ceratobasidium sp. 395]|nr:hypothetical protein FRC09_010841 [Ceratobasidium sp. 395]
MAKQTGNKVLKVQRTVRHPQLPMTPAYAFTDYRSQGQAILAAIVDIAPPPSGKKLTLYNIYVALSRSSGRDTTSICWLRITDWISGTQLQPVGGRTYRMLLTRTRK